QAIAQSRRARGEFAVLLIDLDRFKLVNDSLGHRAGDELLKEVGRRLQSVTRDADTLTRFGGDEVVAIVSAADCRRVAEEFAERILGVLQPAIPMAGVDIRACASIGMAFYPQDGVTGPTLLAHADTAMYAAKDKGGSRARSYDSAA